VLAVSTALARAGCEVARRRIKAKGKREVIIKAAIFSFAFRVCETIILYFDFRWL
jgi:hypothetical protein